MTTLLVTAFALDAPDSLERMISATEILADVEDMSDRTPREMAATLRRGREILRGYVTTDDGTPVDDALKRLSVAEFIRALAGLLAVDPVPLENGASSPGPSPALAGGRVSAGMST